MNIEIRGQSFNIDLVNNWCLEKYQDLMDIAIKITSFDDEVREIAESEIDKKEATELLKAKVKEYRQLSKDSISIRNEILVELLESNGLKYDSNFWMRKCGTNDINKFVTTCIKKDTSESKGSKKK